MKLLGLLFLVIPTWFAVPKHSADLVNNDPIIDIVVTTASCDELSYSFPLSQISCFDAAGLDEQLSDVVACSFIWPNYPQEGCSVSAGTCSAAEAGFNSCMCEEGFDHYCPEGPGGGVGGPSPGGN